MMDQMGINAFFFGAGVSLSRLDIHGTAVFTFITILAGPSWYSKRSCRRAISMVEASNYLAMGLLGLFICDD